jgi:hypothetical protein
VPDDAQTGSYAGDVTVTAGGKPVGAIHIALDVLPIKLADPPFGLGFNYSKPDDDKDGRILAAHLADMREHSALPRPDRKHQARCPSQLNGTDDTICFRVHICSLTGPLAGRLAQELPPRQRAASSQPDEELKERLAALLSKAGLTPPYLDELPKLLGAPAPRVGSLVKLLEKEGRAVRVSQDLYFDAAAISALRKKLVGFIEEHQRINTQEFKELVGATRKWTIPLAEHFDREKVTLRVGEARVLRGASSGARPAE